MRRLRRRVGRTLKLLGLQTAEICILLTDDREIHELNQQYRKKDSATDVLSFSQFEEGDSLIPDHPVLLGDIIISVDTAARQVGDGCLPRIADALRHNEATRTVPDRWSLDDEVTCLMVHGLLHLIGHDHLEEADASAMFEIEAELIPQLLRYRAA